ncbi:MAG: protein kinase [Nitrosomonadales bacterium]|nr:protein kinase [Nitrosomonadales bacterium]
MKRNGPIEATVVSVIIRDFIHLTERLSAISLTDLMGDYYEKVCIQVEQQDGVLTSISNHSMVVTFAGVEGEDAHARRALRCALAIAMIAYQTRFWIRQAFPEQGLDKFGVGIGIHSGELILAEFGLAPQIQQVANGHAVSVASLLAVKSKELDWNVVCSEQSLAAAGQGVQIRRRALIGAEWLKSPVSVAEVVVVRDGETAEEVNEAAPGRILDTTLDMDRGTRSGRFPVFDPARYAAGESADAADFPAIPGYRCLRPIGQGGMSRVFLVERLRDGAHLALKFADGSVSEDSDVLYRFVEEYGLLEQVHHPNVLQIFDQGVTDDVLFIVMEHLPGGTLKQHIGGKGMEPERAWTVLREMVQALVEIHRMGIIHRDIKPENIMLRKDGTAVLGDFGVARRIYKVRHYDQLEYIVGTPYFMSPEQALGEDEDERTDVYSMGAVFFNMLTGEKPFRGDTLEEIVQQHLHAPVPKLPLRYRHLQFFLDRMMSKDREQRYSASELLNLLDELHVLS